MVGEMVEEARARVALVMGVEARMVEEEMAEVE